MKKILLIFIVTLSFFSCDNYLTEEGNPNGPQDALVTPDKKLAAAINGMLRTQTTTLNQYGNRLTYAWGYNVNAFAGGNLDEFTYNYTTQTAFTIWESLYLGMDNFQNILDFPNPNNKYDYHVGVAKIMKVQGMQHIISLYGDAPYSQAFKQGANVSPAYDDDKEIFKSLITELSEARALLSGTEPTTLAMTSEDIVFGGVTSKWIDFANTLELKLLLKLSNTTDPTMIAYRNSKFATDLTGVSFIDADVFMNPGYNASTTLNYTPMYLSFGRGLNAAFGDGYRSNAAGYYLARVLMGQETNSHIASVLDPRRSRIFKGATIVGVKQGDVTPAAGGTAPASISQLGQYVTGDLSFVTPGVTSNPLWVKDILNNGGTRNCYIMLRAESKFLQAEAEQRGYLVGTAQNDFEEGIRASMKFYSTLWGTIIPSNGGIAAPITAADQNTYISTTTVGKIGLNWAATPDKIEAIMTQKWLALNGISGIEPYLDYVRTGYPNLPLPIATNKPNRPNRLLYPNSEYSTNSSNTPIVTVGDIFTVNTKSPFYLQ